MVNSKGRRTYCIAGCPIHKFTASNRHANKVILHVKDFMVENVDKRLPRLKVWTVFGKIMNPANWGDETEETFRSVLSDPAKGMEEDTELGPGSYIFSVYRGIFKRNQIVDYEKFEDSAARCLVKASEIRKTEPSIRRIDL